MTLKEINPLRLYNQRITNTPFTMPAEIVGWLGAVQAQDYLASLWGIGLRLQKTTELDVEQAFRDRTIIRTWSLRGTLHVVSATDVHWLLDLVASRLLASHANRLMKEFELDEKTITRCKKVLVSALKDKTQLTRDAVYRALERAQISVAKQRGLQILWRLAQEKVVCFGAREGKEHTFALLDKWVPKTNLLTHDEGLSELANRYFTSHGPATLQDFIWWSGLASMDAKKGLEMTKSKLIKESIKEQNYWMSNGTMSKALSAVHLLPGFDEYLLGYADRSLSLDMHNFGKLVYTNNGIFNPTIVSSGKVVGVWKRLVKKNSVKIDVKPFTSFSKMQSKAIEKVANKYGIFLNTEIAF